MQKSKSAYERSVLTITEFQTEDIITTSGPDLLEGLGSRDNESSVAGGTKIFPTK